MVSSVATPLSASTAYSPTRLDEGGLRGAYLNLTRNAVYNGPAMVAACALLDPPGRHTRGRAALRDLFGN